MLGDRRGRHPGVVRRWNGACCCWWLVRGNGEMDNSKLVCGRVKVKQPGIQDAKTHLADRLNVTKPPIFQRLAVPFSVFFIEPKAKKE